MKLFYSPGACSIGIHVLLEEIGKPYDTAAVNFRDAEQFKSPFADLNPKSKVPTLVLEDGSVLTEFPAIAYYLARLNPGLKLLPDDFVGQAHCLSLMDYAVATIHMQGFSRLFRPTNFAPNATDEEAVKARGTEIVAKGFALMDNALAGRDYLLGTFSVADTALFYVEFWAKRLKLPLPANCAAHLERMLARPAVQATLAAEGLA
jgi:glutathione S-transferase